MKRLALLLAMVVFVCTGAFAQSMYFDFEGQTAGNKIAQTLGDPWTTWSNAPGGAEDGVFDEAGGSMAAHFTYGNDQVLLLGGIETGVFDLVFDAFVPNGKCGYFNVLHHFAGSGSTWAAQFYLCATNDGSTGSTTVGEGHGTVHAGSNSTADIPCVWDQWMKYRVHIDMDQDLATLYWNIAGQPEQEICSWQWSLDSFGSNVVGRTLDAMDFYPPSNGAEYYVDNIGIVSGAEDQVLISDDFEAYTVGNKIAVEAQAAGNDWWTTWSSAPGGAEDGVIAEYGGSKCGYLTYGNDQVLLLGDEENGAYDLEFDILVPDGKNGYFNILHDFNGSSSTWALECYLHMALNGTSTVHSPGSSLLNVAGGSIEGPTVVYDQWMHFRLHVDTDTDVAEYYYTAPGADEVLVYTWQWSLDTQGNAYGRKLAAMDFFPPQNAANSQYYLDNFTYTKFGAETSASLTFDTESIYVELDPDDVNAYQIGISNANGTSIGDWTAWVDFGEGAGGTATSQINYDVEPSASTSLVGWNYEDPVLIEVAAMYPGSSYAGAAMGTKIASVQYYCVSSSSGFGVEAGTPLTFRVYAQGINGQPGEVLAEKVVPYAQINQEDWTIATFDTPVPLTGYNVWVACEYTQAVGGYAMAFDGTSYVPGSGYYRTQGGGAFVALSPDNLSDDYGNLHIRANVQGAPVAAGWANLSKSEGSMPIGGSDEVTLTVNSFNLTNGSVYDANIIFRTNDPDNAEVRIPLTLHVGVTGVEDMTNNMASVYPNPATNRVVVEGENLTAVAIYNVAGQLIRIERLDSVTNTIEMNVEAGIYFFNIYDNNGRTAVQRVVITK